MQHLTTEYLRNHLEHVRKVGVSHDPSNGLQATLDFQDAIGTASLPEIYEVYKDLSVPDRRTFVFACTASLCPEMAEEVIKETVVRFMRWRELQSMNAEFEKGWNELGAAELRFNDAKKSIHKRLNEQKRRIKELANKLIRAEQEVQALHYDLSFARGKMRENREYAEKYLQIKALLS